MQIIIPFPFIFTRAPLLERLGEPGQRSHLNYGGLGGPETVFVTSLELLQYQDDEPVHDDHGHIGLEIPEGDAGLYFGDGGFGSRLPLGDDEVLALRKAAVLHRPDSCPVAQELQFMRNHEDGRPLGVDAPDLLHDLV